MEISKILFNLKSGSEVEIRSPKESDVEKVISYLFKTAGETEFIYRYPEECYIYTPEKEMLLFKKINESETEAMLLCLKDNEVIGDCRISWNKRIKTKHRANLSIAVLQKYWSQGVGSKLLSEAINIVNNNKDILQIELDFVEGNSRARALYEKFGFRITGVKPSAIRLRNGKLLNEYSMVKEF
ncbi:GNAT family N-acetyltransferase [Streptococcus parauberis]|uniref:Acetyltransferase, GNAT family n=1 Tax=Streptococcus parauberis NCFD 2020 TaxID=873447 RepID=F1YZX3_9STRE|nr:GNAT family N-acetyltransferase [Streptococcus parauberis]EGE55044.1 acetyltransferase, GNAT family [Streptococcus parauberis NCFD 2020]